MISKKKKGHASYSWFLLFWMLFWESLSNPQLVRRVKKKQTFCQSWEWFPFVLFPVTSLSITAFHAHLTHSALFLWNDAEFCLRKQASFSNEPRYLLVAFLFISSEIGDSIFRLCLRATHSVSTRCQRKMARVILRDAKGSPRGQHERLSELCAGKRLLI